ncbi:MAG: acyl-CoA dehydrogenase family protein, partial [Chloroflexi bacterium]|nr:acyl-CoA dehydrogenase family protein [Chloroflexota bacterium]
MDWRFAAEEEAFRNEVRAFLKGALPPDWQGFADSDEYNPEGLAWTREMTRKLVANGWLTMAWPKKYGGQERSVMQQIVFKEEMSYNHIPITALGSAGTSWVGPALMVSGTEEQKAYHLPRIAKAQSYWCTGYSEPNTGSDLASLETKAARDGDDYVVNGTKIWTSSAHLSDWCWCAVRTDPEAPKHKGITMLLVDMKSPGVSVQPIPEISGHHVFNQVFFNNVRVPIKNRVGEENRGWYVLAMALDFERSGIFGAAQSLRKMRDLELFLQDTQWRSVLEGRQQIVRNQFAELAIEARIGRNLAYRIGWMQSKGMLPNAETSIAKIMLSETSKRIADFGISIMGPYGQLEPGSKWAPLKGRLERFYLTARATTIGAGTSEVQ